MPGCIAEHIANAKTISRPIWAASSNLGVPRAEALVEPPIWWSRVQSGNGPSVISWMSVACKPRASASPNVTLV